MATRTNLKPSRSTTIGAVSGALLVLFCLAALYTVLEESRQSSGEKETKNEEEEEEEDSGNHFCQEDSELAELTITSLFQEEDTGYDDDECVRSNIVASSCREITKAGLPSGEYWIRTVTGGSSTQQQQFYCDTTRSCCNKTGGWTRVAHLSMSDPDHSCPEEWREILTPRRTCGRKSSSAKTHQEQQEEDGSNSASCSSAIFPTHRLQYSYICGRIVGYQYCNTLAFWAYYHNMADITIDDPYVDGVTITYGAPRKHVWTFATALHEDYGGRDTICPCTNTNYRDTHRMARIPPWVGGEYFCETGAKSVPPNSSRTCQTQYKENFYTSDPLWDGNGCGMSSTCCEYYSPPWFCKQLAEPTRDDIEVRICGSGLVEFGDTPIETVEIYVQ